MDATLTIYLVLTSSVGYNSLLTVFMFPILFINANKGQTKSKDRHFPINSLDLRSFESSLKLYPLIIGNPVIIVKTNYSP